MAEDAGIHGCFFCGASVVIDKAEKDKVAYTCTGCGKKVTVAVAKPKKAKD